MHYLNEKLEKEYEDMFFIEVVHVL
jgi:hypothetical protein